MPAIGELNLLRPNRVTPHGFYLDGGEYGDILLPHSLAPAGAEIDQDIEVFLYRDSEDRLIATTERPLAYADEFATLRVVDYRPGVGAFLDLGISKHLLLPLSEQKGHVQVGDQVVVYVQVDDYTDRLVATMRLDRYLDQSKPRYREDEQVDLIIAGETPLGYNAIVNKAHRGLLYHSNLNSRLQIGQQLKGYVQTIRDDGKLDLRLDAVGYSRIAPLADQIIETLKAADGRLAVNDQSSPEEIRARFGVSKKAFKQAVGQLLRQNRVRFEGAELCLIGS